MPSRECALNSNVRLKPYSTVCCLQVQIVHSWIFRSELRRRPFWHCRTTLINARRACLRVTVVCLFVSMSVLKLVACIWRVCNTLNLPVKSLVNSKGFQLTDFAKKVPFPSCSLIFIFTQPSRPFAIRWSCHVVNSSDDLYLQVLRVGKWSSDVKYAYCMHS